MLCLFPLQQDQRFLAKMVNRTSTKSLRMTLLQFNRTASGATPTRLEESSLNLSLAVQVDLRKVWALVWTGGAPSTDPVITPFVKMGYINATGHWVIHSRFEYYFFDDFSAGLVPFRKQSSKWGYMDRMGKIVIRPRFDWAGNFSGDIAPALLDGKCAHVDKTGRVTDQSRTILPRRRDDQDSRGTYLFKPHPPPCS